MNILPDSTIILCKIPNSITIDYTDTITFKDEASRFEYFSSKAVKRVEKYSIVRKEESILRIEGDYSQYMECNYMIFKNSNFYNKNFYAFITSVNYITPNTTEIRFFIDVMQTWFFTDCTLMNCVIEREHVEHDEPYNVENTMPEGIELGEYITFESIDFKNLLGSKYVMLELSEQMPAEITSTAEWTEALSNGYIKELPPGVYNGLYKANHSYAFLYIEATLKTVIPAAMDYFARAGKLEMVECLYITYENFFNTSEEMVDISTEIEKPSIINEYTPRNKKLLMYPYNYLELEASGQKQQIKYELIPSEKIKINISGYMEPGTPIYMSIPNYENFDLSYGIGVATPGLPLLQYTKREVLNNYQTSQNSRTLGLAYDLISGGINAISGTLGASSSLSYNNFTPQNPSINLTRGMPAVGGMNQASTLGGLAGVGLAGGKAAIGWVMNVNRTYDLYKAAAQDVLNRPSNTSYLNALPSLLYTHNRPCPIVKRMTLWYPYLKKIDDYFDRFGYKSLAFKIPNINSRKSWNYLKLIEVDIDGSINQEYIEQIKNILQNGITFWHTTDVGNYDLDNSIITVS